MYVISQSSATRGIHADRRHFSRTHLLQQAIGGFLYKTSASLYFYLNRQPRPFGPNTGSSANDAAAQRKSFGIEDPLFLDRYSWELRQQTTKLREAQHAASADLGRLQARITKLGVCGQTGQLIIEPLSNGADKPADVDLERKKALLRKSIDYLEKSSLSEEDEQRRLSQIYLVEKLTKLSNMLGEESKSELPFAYWLGRGTELEELG